MTRTSTSDSRATPTGPAIGMLCILGSLAGWTTIPLFLRWFRHDVDAWTANGWRYAVSAFIWLPPLLWAGFKGRMPAGLWKAALVPSLFNAAAQVCFGLAPYYISPSLMTFSLRIQIVFVTIAAALMFPAERKIIRTPHYLIGLGLVLSGTLLTVALSPQGLQSDKTEQRDLIKGVLLSMGSGIGYAAYALSVRKYMSGMKPLLAFAAVSQYTAVALFGLMLAFAQNLTTLAFDHGMGVFAMQPLESKLTLLVLSSIIGIGLGHTLYFIAISRLGVAVSASVVQLQPITVSIGAMVVFQTAEDHLTALQWGTGMLAIAGAFLILWTQYAASKQASRAAALIADESR